MRRIGISITLLAIMFLITSALNISNAGINQLTGEDRKAVLAVKMEDNDLCLQLLGEEYQCFEALAYCTGYIEDLGMEIINYLYSIAHIFKAVLSSL